MTAEDARTLAKHQLAQAVADVTAQRKVVDKISDLLDDERHDLAALEQLLQLRIEAVWGR